MLTFLTGTDAEAKREEIGRGLLEAANGGKTAVLLVPEQASFERDRALLLRFGAKARSLFQVTSFARFAEDLLEQNDIVLRPRADAAGAAVLMRLALQQCAPSLRIYARHERRPASVRSLLAVYEAVRQEGVTVEELGRLSGRVEGALKEKTRELAAIFSVYEALLTPRFSNAADNIHRAALLLERRRLFRNAVFYIDDVRSFSGVQRRLLQALLTQADVFITLPGSNAGCLTFPHAQRQKTRLIAAARAANTRVFEREIPPTHTESVFGFLREHLFSADDAVLETPTDAVTLVAAANRYDECARIAGQIKALLESGVCRAREIAVLIRDAQYLPALTSAMKQCSIPVFEDKRRPLCQYPPARLLLHAAAVAANGFSTEEIFSLLKTGLAGVSDADCGALENYVFRWQIDGGAWTRPFTEHPEGFGVPFTDGARETLAGLEALRRRIAEPLQRLSAAFRKQDAEESCRALYFYLKELQADKALLRHAEYLYENGDETEALACDRAWERCMQALDALSDAVGKQPVSPADFYALLTTILSDTALGEIPSGVDQILIGTLEHTRALTPKVVFAAGMNEGVFPAAAAPNGVFTVKETRALSDLDVNLFRLPEEVYETEQLVAYEAFTSPELRLYLSWPAAATGGEKLEPSPFIGELLRRVPGAVRTDTLSLAQTDRIVSPASAFGVYAEEMRKNTVLGSSLKALLSEEPVSAGQLSALERAAAGVQAAFTDPDEARRLFGNDLYFSASKAETFAKCPFMFFCRYGLGAQQITASKLDVRVNGLVVHHVLDVILSAHREETIAGLSDDLLKSEISAAVADYVNTYMGGAEALPAYLIRSLKKTEGVIFEILLRLRDEWNTCSFVTVDTELKIGGRDAGIPAYRLPLPDGGSVSIGGSVDRVDLMKTPEANYVRVIDYKTGGKELKLSDVFYGLNMQMLIYLFAICENGEAYYGPLLPAGVLYVPANTGGKTLGRHETAEEVKKQKLRNGRMNGVILENADVLKGMESGARGVYINAEIKEDGTMKGSFLSLAEFRQLHRKTDAILREIGMALHEGRIPAEPAATDGAKRVCDYCDYAAVCLKERGCRQREIGRFSHEDARKLLREEIEDGKNTMDAAAEAGD